MSKTCVLISSLLISLACLPPKAIAQTDVSSLIGEPAHARVLPVRFGQANLDTGDLHLEIPLYSVPERGLAQNQVFLAYDSFLWHSTQDFGTNPGIGTMLYPTGTAWNLVTSGANGLAPVAQVASVTDCSTRRTGDTGTIQTSSVWTATDAHGTLHQFDLYTVHNTCVFANSSTPDTAAQPQSSGGSTYAIDGTGHEIVVNNDGVTATVYEPDGYFKGETPNGNIYERYASNGSGLVDELGAPLSLSNNCGHSLGIGMAGVVVSNQPYSAQSNVICTATMPAWDGATQLATTASYTFTYQYIPVCTKFYNSSPDQYDYCGGMWVLESLALPGALGVYRFQYDSGTSGTHLGLLTSINLPTGGTVSYTYGSGPSGTISNSTPFLTSVSDIGGTTTITYAATSGYPYPETITFPSHPITAGGTQPIQDQRVITSQAGGSSAYGPYTIQDYSGNALIQTTVETRDSSNRITSVQSTWNATGETHKVTYAYQGNTNFVTQENEYDSGTLVRTLATQYLQDTSTIPYVSQYNMLVYPVSKSLLDGSGNIAAQTLYTYDEYSANYCQASYPAGMSGIPMLTSVTGASGHDDSRGTSYLARGNVTTVQRLISPGVYSTTHNCYDTLGNVVQTIDPDNHATRIGYVDNYLEMACISPGSNTYAFPTTVTDALGHQTKTGYFTCNRAPGQVQNPNDVVNNRPGTTSTFDVTGRPLCVMAADGGSSCTSYPTENEIDQWASINSGASKSTRTLLDSYGRATSVIDNHSGVEVDTSYDDLGHTNCTSNPYTPGQSSPAGNTCYAYDVLSRVVGVLHPDSSTEAWQFGGNTVTYTDGRGSRWKRKSDALGRLTYVWEPNGTSGVPTMETDYSYDVLNNLKGITQWGGPNGTAGAESRVFKYDSLSRLIQANNPETGWTCYGTTGGAIPNGSNCTSGYDRAGNLLYKTDGRPVQVSYSYDALNRVTSKSYSDGATSTAAYGYDGKDQKGNPISGLQNSIGQLSRSFNGLNAASNYSYDKMGRLNQKAYCLPGDCSYTVSVSGTYDYAGNLGTMTNGISNPAVTFSYTHDASDRLSSITSSWSDSTHPATIFSATNYSASGLTAAQLGVDNAGTPTLSITRGYDLRGRLVSESDNTSKVQTTAATGSSGTISIGGTEQSLTKPGTYATTSLTIIGSEQSTTFNACPPHTCMQTIYDGGGDTVYVNGVSAGGFGWGSGATASSLASSLVSSINGNSSSPVTASASGATVTLTSKANGPSGNYGISVSTSWSLNSYFSSPSFTVSSPSAMSGGTSGPTINDSGTVTVTINGVSAKWTWSGGYTATSLAGHLSSAMQTAFAGILNVTNSGSLISVSSISTGSNTNWPISTATTYDSTDFSSASFSASATGMSGGNPAGYTNQVVYSYSVPTQGGFDEDGNLTSVADSAIGNWSYSYDTLNRLLTAGASSGQYSGKNGCWSYDGFSNRLAENWQTAACQTPMSSVPITASYNGLNRVTWSSVNAAVNGFLYDGAGNVLDDNAYKYLYDGEGRLCAVQNKTVPSVMTGYVYDGEGNRVAKGSLATFTCNFATNGFSEISRFVIGLQGEQLTELTSSGTWVHTNVFSGSTLLAAYLSTDTYLMVSDWLGTRRAEVTPDGQYATYFNLPFGNLQSSSGSAPDATEHHFTGKEHDSESGNDYFGARSYSSSTGRFLSPDPSGLTYADVTNPQSLNHYSYVRNNPLRYTDPAGLYCFYGGNGDTIETDSDPSDYDFSSEGPGECGGSGGQWIDNPSSTITVSPDGDDGNVLSTFPTDVSTTYQFIPGKGCASALKMAGGSAQSINNFYNIYQADIQSAAQNGGIDPPMLGAIGIRESGLPSDPRVVERRKNGTIGNGRGLFQIDLGKNKGVSQASAFDPTISGNIAAQMLASNLETLAAKHPNLTAPQLLQATFASYNFGTKNIHGNPQTIDKGSTGGNYGSNVLAIAVNCF